MGHAAFAVFPIEGYCHKNVLHHSDAWQDTFKSAVQMYLSAALLPAAQALALDELLPAACEQLQESGQVQRTRCLQKTSPGAKRLQ